MLYTPPFFIVHHDIFLLFVLVSLKDKKANCRLPYLSNVFKNSNYQCFIPVLTESTTSLSQSHPPKLMLVGTLNIEAIFHIFFPSTPGPLPSLSFSHHANWQKLVPFALFIYLAETACSLDATASQS